MINLLPNENRKQLKYSFYNVIILKLIFLTIICSIIISGMFIFASVSLKAEELALKSELIYNENKFSNLDHIKKESDQIIKDSKSAKQIFNEQKHYSNFLIELAKYLPKDISINRLAISPDLTKSPATIRVKTKDYNTIISTKQKLEESPLIEAVSINSVVDDKKNDKTTVLSIQFNKKGVEEVLKWQK